MLKKILRYFVRIAGGLGCLLVILWLVLALVVTVKKEFIIQKARTALKDQFGGDLNIQDMEVNFFHHFPNITLHLTRVTLRDSLWQQHHHDLLNADNLYVHVAVFRSLFAGKARPGTIYIEHGSIYLFTDLTGYSNTSVLKSRKAQPLPNGRKETIKPPDIHLTDIRFVMDNQDRHKFFDVEFHRLECGIDEDDRTWSIDTRVDASIKSFAFNVEKGSFIKDKQLAGRFTLVYSPGSKILQFDKVPLRIDNHPFVLTGRFFPDVRPDPFILHIHTTNIPYQQATALLTPLIQQKLDLYEVDQPVTIDATLDAGSADDPTPQITVQMNLRNASINTPPGRFTGVTAMASFTNEYIRHEKRRDENSAIRLTSFRGNFLNIPVHSDSVVITDLKNPIMYCDVHASFALDRLNDLLGSRSIQFRKGSCTADLQFKGPLKEGDTTAVMLSGGLSMDSGAISYIPYDFELNACTGKIRFKDKDLLFDQLAARTGDSRISLKGVVKNITPIFNRPPQHVYMDFTLSSPLLNLEDLTPVLGKPKGGAPVSRKSSGHPLGQSAGRLDDLLREGTIHLQIDAPEVRYQHFTGARAAAEVFFQNNEVTLKQMQLTQDGGSLTLHGTLRRPSSGGNVLTFHSHIEQVDVHKLFAAFNDFGQEAISNKNLKGKLTADVEMAGRLTDKAKIIKNSLKGSVGFTIRDGQLIDYEPMQKVHETVLKNRDLSEIRFAELKNQLDLDTTTFTIHRMEIQSTAFTLFVEGTYDMKAGPDLSLQVPLSNLKKNRNTEIPPESKGNDGKAGLSLRLRARKGDDGKMKISWDPFKKALKKMSGKTPA